MSSMTGPSDRTFASRLMMGAGPVLLLALGAAVVASAQSNSPFASQKKRQAWETPQEPAPATNNTPSSPNETLQGGYPATAPMPRVPALRGGSAAPSAMRPQEQNQPQIQPQFPPQTQPLQSAPQANRAINNDVRPTPDNFGAAYSTPQKQPAIAPQPYNAPVQRPQSTSPFTSQPQQNRRSPSPTIVGQDSQSGQSSSARSPFAPPASAPRNYGHQSYGNQGYGNQAYNPNNNYGTAPSAGATYQSRSYNNAQGGYGANDPNNYAPNSYSNGRMPSRSLSSPNSSLPAGSGVYSNPELAGGPNNSPTQQGYRNQGYAQNAPEASSPYGQPNYAPNSGPLQSAPRKRTWTERLGFGTLSALFKGALRGGGGARDLGGWEEVFVGQADAELEVSAITQGGLEYGVNLGARAEYEKGRKGFTRRLPDCPPTLSGCPVAYSSPVPIAVRGHTTQFYTDGPDVAKDTQAALESAHLFLRSAYGDVTVGRDNGAAYLFSLGAPTLLNTGASNASVDYTGLDSVKTVNNASGFSEKVTYTSPRLLGDQIGVGVQFGVSYALDPYACGVDYCTERDAVTNVLSPDLKDVVEVGVALDRTFDGGLSVEGTVTYARASEVSGRPVFNDLETYGAGIEVKLSDWTLGSSWLTSNQGLSARDYEAYDVGLTWKPSALGFTLGYGHASDELVGLKSDQFIGGVSWDYNERIRFGTGVQYTQRESLRDLGGLTAQIGKEDGLGVFLEGGITF